VGRTPIKGEKLLQWWEPPQTSSKVNVDESIGLGLERWVRMQLRIFFSWVSIQRSKTKG